MGRAIRRNRRKPTKRLSFLCASLFTLAVPFVRVSANQEGVPANIERLRRVLAETSAYCEKLKSMALDFVCQEKVTEVSNDFVKRVGRKSISGDINETQLVEDLRIRKTLRNDFVYDYQLIKKSGVFREQRNLIEENGRKRDVKNASLKDERIKAEMLVFGPVGFLSQYWQEHFVFAIAGEDRIGGQSALILTASPASVREDNYYEGRIWIAAEDSSILRIDWTALAPEASKDKVASLIGDLKRSVTMTAEYGIVKNGVRFPSRRIAKETFTTPEGKEHLKYESKCSYLNYKFFTVETEVSIK